MLADVRGGYEQPEEQDQRHGDENLRCDAGVVVVHLCPGLAADRASTLDYRARAMRADKVLTAHLYPFRLRRPGCTWRDLEAWLPISP